MGYKRGFNNHRVLQLKLSDTNYISSTRISISPNKSKTIIKNNYRYVRLQGEIYTLRFSRAWASAPIQAWLKQKVHTDPSIPENEQSCIPSCDLLASKIVPPTLKEILA